MKISKMKKNDQNEQKKNEISALQKEISDLKNKIEKQEAVIATLQSKQTDQEEIKQAVEYMKKEIERLKKPKTTTEDTNANDMRRSIKRKIIKANDLPKIEFYGVYTLAVISLYDNSNKKKERVKTDAKLDSQDPVYNKDFVFNNITNDDYMRVEIFSYHRLLGDQCIGCVDIRLDDVKDDKYEQCFKIDKPPKAPKTVREITDFGSITISFQFI